MDTNEKALNHARKDAEAVREFASVQGDVGHKDPKTPCPESRQHTFNPFTHPSRLHSSHYKPRTTNWQLWRIELAGSGAFLWQFCCVRHECRLLGQQISKIIPASRKQQLFEITGPETILQASMLREQCSVTNLKMLCALSSSN